MKTRDRIFWLLWLLFVIALIWVCCRQAAKAETKVIRVNRTGVFSPKYQEQLIPRMITLRESLPPPLPAAPPSFQFPPIYFGCTAVNLSGLESPFSNEVTLIPMRGQWTAALAWDASPSLGVDHYLVYRGTKPSIYTTNFNSGDNLRLVVPLYPPRPTNLVIVVTSVNATNLQWATALGKSWSLLGATNYTATNPPMRMWRGMGRSKSNPPRLTIKSSWQ